MICLFIILSIGDCLLLIFGFEIFSDVWRLGLILITFWIGILTLVGGYKLRGYYYNNQYLGALVSFLTVILLASFSEASLLGFYFFFWVFINSHAFDYFRVRVSTWTSTGRFIFYFLYIRSLSTSFIFYHLLLFQVWGARNLFMIGFLFGGYEIVSWVDCCWCLFN